MKYIYISCYFPIRCMEKFLDKKQINLAAQKYHRLMIEGVLDNKIDMICLSLLPINRKNTSKLYIPKRKFDNYISPSVLNVPILKQIWSFISITKVLINLDKREETSIIVDGLNITGALCALLVSKIRAWKNLCIITDMPGCLANNSLNILRLINQKIIKQFDYYVFLTKYMNDIINTREENYIVLEGQVEKVVNKLIVHEKRKKIIMYTGSIHKIYGIENLVKGFLSASLEGYELHIYGDGDYKTELEKITQKHKNIKFFGVVDNERIINLQKEAMLLVNPRPISDKFTLYSFPSKNMEYMNSGTAMITTKLPGIPDEYSNYIFYFPDDTVGGIKKGLEMVLNLPESLLLEKGKRAFEFVQNEKNKDAQAMKMLSILQKEGK